MCGRPAQRRRCSAHLNVAAIAERLVTVSLRHWHDQILFREPGTGSAAPGFHQEQPFWSHAQSTRAISAWSALGYVPVERGRMTFLPGSWRRTDLEAQDLADGHDLIRKAADLA